MFYETRVSLAPSFDHHRATACTRPTRHQACRQIPIWSLGWISFHPTAHRRRTDSALQWSDCRPTCLSLGPVCSRAGNLGSMESNVMAGRALLGSLQLPDGQRRCANFLVQEKVMQGISRAADYRAFRCIAPKLLELVIVSKSIAQPFAGDCCCSSLQMWHTLILQMIGRSQLSWMLPMAAKHRNKVNSLIANHTPWPSFWVTYGIWTWVHNFCTKFCLKKLSFGNLGIWNCLTFL